MIYEGKVDEIVRENAYCRICDRNGKEFLVTLDANFLSANGIGEGDVFVCLFNVLDKPRGLTEEEFQNIKKEAEELKDV